MSLWRNRDFLLLWGGQTISQVGSAVTGVALPLAAVLVLHANAAQMGILGALGTAPFLLVALFAGAFADRVRRRPLLVAADIARALLMAAVPALYLLGRLSMADLYAIAFVAGLATVLF
ncbi:MAG TPA: MFS transporter, partial [Bacillota bacterium]|nr:MFS transporter [Bacillota bacterium]